mmetsp:Transcript_6600/g.11386  ORF Transcript_6600/g.11386 Transcript_6600/m.11386 type:complete len:263 (-) Transcript_6600:124-912(-)
MIVFTPQTACQVPTAPGRGLPHPCRFVVKSPLNNDEKKPEQTGGKEANDKTKESRSKTPLRPTKVDNSRVFMERAPIHVEETPDSATIALDVAGFSAEDIEVRLEDHVVSIFGKRVNRLGDTYVIRRRFRLDKSTVLAENVCARLSENVLELVCPKKPKVGPRSIPILTPRQDQSIVKEASDPDAKTLTLEEPQTEHHHQQSAKNDEKNEDVSKREHAVAQHQEEKTVPVEVETVDEDTVKSQGETKVKPVVEEDAWEEVSE